MKGIFAWMGIAAIVAGCASQPKKEPATAVVSEKAVPLTAEETAGKRLTPEMLWKFGRVGEFRVSPDGTTVVYTVTRYSLTENRSRTTLWTTPVAGGEARCLTADVPSSCSNPRWMADSRIAYLSAADGDAQIWTMTADGNDKRRLSFIDGGINGFDFSPKGDNVLYIKDIQIEKTTAELYPDLPKANAIIADDLMERHWDSWNDHAVSHIFVASPNDGELRDGKDIMAGEPFDSPMEPFFDSEEVSWNADGTAIAYTCKKLKGREYTLSTNSDIYLYDLASGKTRNLTTSGQGYDKFPVFSPDGKQMVYQSMETPGYEADKERLMLCNLADSMALPDYLTADYDNNASNFVWSADGNTLWFISGTNATYQICSIKPSEKIVRPVTAGRHDYGSIALAGNMLVGSRKAMDMATELFRIDPATGKEEQITFTNANIYSAIKMGDVKERTVKTTDGKNMLVWVIYPPDFDPSKKYPVILFCPGGPQSAITQSFSYRWNFELMAAGGYIVVAPNRRGVPTFGQAWNRQISGDYGGQNMLDYLSAIDDVAKEPYADATRMGCVGASYGGYSVYWLAGHHQKRFKAFIAHCGMFNFESKYAGTDEYWFPNFDLGGAYWEKPQPKSYRFSPHLYVDQWDTPILIFEGEKDFRIPYTEGLQAFHAARLRNIPARFVLFPDEGHWVTKPQDAVLWQREFFGWLDKWLK